MKKNLKTIPMMNNKRTTLVCLAALAMTLAGCSQDDAFNPGGDTPVSFSAGLAATASPEGKAIPQTRTANGGDTWLTTDEIGIIMATDQNIPATIVAGGDNVKYRPQSAGASTTLIPVGTPIYWPETVRGYIFIAYHPWLPVGEGGIDPADYTYPMDVSDQSDPAKLDLLQAVAPTSYGDNVSFNFEHKMAKLRVNITAGGTLTAAEFAGATAEANGMPTTGKYSLVTNISSDKGDIAPISLPAITPGEGYAAAFEAIVIHHWPDEEFKGRYLKFTLPGAGDYYWTIPDGTAILRNYINTFNLTITAQGVTFNGSTITPWDDSDPATEGKMKEENERQRFIDWATAYNAGTKTDFTLKKDIDLTGYAWTPVGTDSSNPFTHTFDGGGHTITGLTVNKTTDYAGMFGRITGGTVRNVALTGASVTGAANNVGGIAGNSYDGAITGCSFGGTVNGAIAVGGIVGTNNSSTIAGCSVAIGAEIGGYTGVGGIAGYNMNSTITGCWSAAAKVSGSDFVGGISGNNTSSIAINNCYWLNEATGGNQPDNVAAGSGSVTNCASFTNAAGCNGYVSSMNTAISSYGYQWVRGANPDTDYPTIVKQ